MLVMLGSLLSQPIYRCSDRKASAWDLWCGNYGLWIDAKIERCDVVELLVGLMTCRKSPVQQESKTCFQRGSALTGYHSWRRPGRKRRCCQCATCPCSARTCPLQRAMDANRDDYKWLFWSTKTLSESLSILQPWARSWATQDKHCWLRDLQETVLSTLPVGHGKTPIFGGCSKEQINWTASKIRAVGLGSTFDFTPPRMPRVNSARSESEDVDWMRQPCCCCCSGLGIKGGADGPAADTLCRSWIAARNSGRHPFFATHQSVWHFPLSSQSSIETFCAHHRNSIFRQQMCIPSVSHSEESLGLCLILAVRMKSRLFCLC